LAAGALAIGVSAALFGQRLNASSSRDNGQTDRMVTATVVRPVAVRVTTVKTRRETAKRARLVIPSLDVRAPLVATGAVGSPGTAALTIPRDVGAVGWWDGVVSNGSSQAKVAAPAPGEPGVAIIAGHVDSATAGPGALHDLARLRVGAVIRVVELAGRTTAWHVVASPQITAKTALPDTLFRTSGKPRLALVTCGGPFDAGTGNYRDNVIVWAERS
jgi:hypothetical protein